MNKQNPRNCTQILTCTNLSLHKANYVEYDIYAYKVYNMFVHCFARMLYTHLPTCLGHMKLKLGSHGLAKLKD